MKFQDLPKDAQHHALSTLRELMVVGGENESGADIAAKVKAAFVSMYSDAEKTTHIMNVRISNAPAGLTIAEETAQGISDAAKFMISGGRKPTDANSTKETGCETASPSASDAEKGLIDALIRYVMKDLSKCQGCGKCTHTPLDLRLW
ncbi:hypothetical protein HAX39_25595 [Citrobacter freundii]|nr:hypothetical protein [Citrobacter freundii]